jgi:hypothetical protein
MFALHSIGHSETVARLWTPTPAMTTGGDQRRRATGTMMRGHSAEDHAAIEQALTRTTTRAIAVMTHAGGIETAMSERGVDRCEVARDQ